MRRVLPLVAAFIFMPSAVWALTCTLGVPTDDLFDTRSCVIGGVFTGILCNVQGLINAIMSTIYCHVQYALLWPLAAALTVYIMVFGVQLFLGYVDSPVSDGLMRLLKIGLIWLFAMYSDWGIGLAYRFFFQAMQFGIGWMLQTVTGPSIALPDASSAFVYMDQLVYNLLTGPLSREGTMLAGFIASLSWLVPPVFLLFAYLATTTLFILIRALLAYLLGVSVVAFLMAMSPIFFSLALFRTTRQFFEDWLRHIISFVLQVILIFAGLAFWFRVLATLGSTFLGTLTSMITPVYDIAIVGAMRVPVQSWGICYPAAPCENPWLPTQLVQEGNFIYYLVVNLIFLCIVAYCFDTLMKMLPNLARQLAGPAYAPQLGGGGPSPIGDVAQFPGMSNLWQAGRRGESAFLNARGGLAPRMGAGLRAMVGGGAAGGDEDAEEQRIALNRLREEATALARDANQKLGMLDKDTQGPLRAVLNKQIKDLEAAAQGMDRRSIEEKQAALERTLNTLK